MRQLHKPILKTLLAMVLLIFAACQEDINTPSEGNVPLAADIDVDTDIDISVDPETNQVTFTLKKVGYYPVWKFTEGSNVTYSTVNGLQKIYAGAGTYSVEVKIGNASGISDGSLTKDFIVVNSLVDFDSYIAKIAGTESKAWSIAKQEAAHLACGGSGTIGTEYYSATPNEKAAFGLYDDVLTFDTDKNYTYNPGVGGTVYVNKGATLYAEHNPNNGFDFTAPVSEQETTYEFTVEGNDIFLTFPAQTLFPYIPNDDAYNTPKYRVVSLTPSKMELVIDNGEIAWHYILVSGNAADPGGYNPDHECNMWTDATITNSFYYADANWTPYAEPPGFEAEGNSYAVTLPLATAAQWQAQVAFNTSLTTNTATHYDFSAIFNSSKAHSNVTVKLVKAGGGANDGIFYFEDHIQLEPYEDYAFVKTDMPGIDMANVNLVLDFGGNEAGTEVIISRIVLKEHDCDDGTVIEEPGEDTVNWDDDSDCNLWKGLPYTNFFYYAHGDGWVAYPNPPGFTGGNNTYTVTLPEPSNLQWQAQVHFETELSTEASKTYDFRCILNSSKDISQATIKLTRVGDGDTYFFAQRVNLTAFEDYTFKMPAMAGKDIDKVSVVFDFGGNPADTEVTISSIILKESTCND